MSCRNTLTPYYYNRGLGKSSLWYATYLIGSDTHAVRFISARTSSRTLSFWQ